MSGKEIREKFLNFFKKKEHAIIPSASLVPEGDSSTLFTTAGMQPLVPYLLGQKHPKSNRLANTQKCLRTGDIEEVGDNTHLTFFEMLGNWSLGDYWKKEAINWSYEFLTDKKDGLGLSPERIYITVFGGEGDIPKDDESKEIWIQAGIPKERIFYRGIKDNFWSPGENGPCGPCTEMFYDLHPELDKIKTEKDFDAADNSQRVVEIWNDVFMEYEKKSGKVADKLKQQNVDTGMGLERVAAIMQGVSGVYETDFFLSATDFIGNEAEGIDVRAERIVADHMRAAVFAITDGVEPSNTDRGYIVRRLIRRAAFNMYKNKVSGLDWIKGIVAIFVSFYGQTFSELAEREDEVISIIEDEVRSFYSTLETGLRVFNKISERNLRLPTQDKTGGVSAGDAFMFFTTHGFPVELTKEIAKERGMKLEEDFDRKLKELFSEHQEKSRTATAGKFKGGLAEHTEETVRLHTAHHLLLAALQKVLGGDVKQKGSNITTERLRIDFIFDRKLTDEEKQKTEEIVNKWIKDDLVVVKKEMAKEEAEKIGAEMEFGAKYPDTVSVYLIEDKGGKAISKEFCAGPHVERTGEIGGLRIKKEEASSRGVRRIKAILEK